MLKRLSIQLRRIFSIRGGTDVQGTIDEINSNIALRSSNIWMLICSAMLASIGLDTNSIAVIIGAMLISPLMSPILGIGLAVAIMDRDMLRKSFVNLSIATMITLITSTLYFLLTPLGDLTSELSARTMPTLLDVGVAFFGGIAGIVAGSRKNKTNAIPGVAIATALMPPLCTVGYGLANMDSTVFLGAFYLYFINAVFISVATMLVVTWLKFPKKIELSEDQSTRVKQFLIGFVVLTLIPSIFIFVIVLQKARHERAIRDFVNTEIRSDNRQPLRWDVNDKGKDKRLKVYLLGNSFSAAEKKELDRKLYNYGLGDLRLGIIDMNVSPDEMHSISQDFRSTLTASYDVISTMEEDRSREIEGLKAEIERLKQGTTPEGIFISEAYLVSPLIERLEFEMAATDANVATSDNKRRLIVDFAASADDKEKRPVLQRLRTFSLSRIPFANIEIVERPKPEPTPETVENAN